jgi:hypothetical protein
VDNLNTECPAAGTAKDFRKRPEIVTVSAVDPVEAPPTVS